MERHVSPYGKRLLPKVEETHHPKVKRNASLPSTWKTTQKGKKHITTLYTKKLKKNERSGTCCPYGASRIALW